MATLCSLDHMCSNYTSHAMQKCGMYLLQTFVICDKTRLVFCRIASITNLLCGGGVVWFMVNNWVIWLIGMGTSFPTYPLGFYINPIPFTPVPISTNHPNGSLNSSFLRNQRYWYFGSIPVNASASQGLSYLLLIDMILVSFSLLITGITHKRLPMPVLVAVYCVPCSGPSSCVLLVMKKLFLSESRHISSKLLSCLLKV